MLRRWLVVGILAALALAAVGCGGDSGGGDPLAGLGGGDGSVPAAAELLPAGVPILITLNTDLDSEQWKLAGAIAERFPSTAGLIDSTLTAMAGDGVDFDTDVRPILGQDVTVAILELAADSPPFAILLQPSDPAKLDEFLARGQSENPTDAPAWRVVDDWYVLADDEATIDTLLAGAEQSSLADDAQFGEIMAALPGDSLARMWISPAVTSELGSQIAADDLAGLESLQALVGGADLGSFDGGGLALLAKEEGVQLVGLTKTTGLAVPATGKAEILELAPAGALGYVSLRDLRESVSRLIDAAIASQPGLETQLAQAEALLGFTIEDDVLPLFDNEHAVYLRPGVPFPEITVVLSPDDSAESMELLAKLLAVAELAGDDLALASEDVEIDGREALKVTITGQTVFFADVEDHLVVTTVLAGIEDFGSSDNMNDDPRFNAARDAAGLPDETAGFVYVDMKGALELISLGGLLGGEGGAAIDPALLENLEPLGSILAYGTGSSDEQRFAALLTIE